MIKTFQFFLYAVIGILMFGIFITSIENSPLRPPQWIRSNLLSVMPQGWSFFTKPPNDSYLFLYSRTPQGWRPIDISSLEDGLGFTRVSTTFIRFLGVATNLSPVTNCNSMEDDCLLNSTPKLISYERPPVCGELAIAKRKLVPWAWSGKVKEMPAKVFHLRVACG